MSRLKTDGTKVNIIEGKTNFIERLEWEKFYPLKEKSSIIRKKHSKVNINYFKKNVCSKVKYEGTSDLLKIIFPNSNKCLLEIKLKPEFTNTLKFIDITFYTKDFKSENNIDDIFILGEIITKIQTNYNQILNDLNQFCIEIDSDLKLLREELNFIKRIFQSINTDENYDWVYQNIKEKLTTEGIMFDNINNSNYFKEEWFPTKVKLNKDNSILVHSHESTSPVKVEYSVNSFHHMLDYIFTNSFYISNLEKNIVYNHEKYKEKFGYPK